MLMAGVSIIAKLLERQYLSVDKWQNSCILSYYEDTIISRVREQPARKEVVFSGRGTIQSIAISNDSEYIATGHTSTNHQVIVHALRPKIHPISTLIGHSRTPWCLTFDPCLRKIIYSGGLEGVVKKWNFESSCLLATFASETAAAPITDIIPLLTSEYILVGTKHSLYLLDSEQLDVVWEAKCTEGTFLRLVRHFPQERKLLTAKRLPEHHSYKLQLVDFNFGTPPDLSNTSTGVITECPLVPYCFAITTKQIFFSEDNQVIGSDMTGKRTIYGRIGVLKLMAVSPCEKYLLLIQRLGLPSFVRSYCCSLVLIDLEAKWPVSVNTKWDIMDPQPLHVNCAVWMPLTSPYPLDLCIGDTLGHLILSTM